MNARGGIYPIKGDPCKTGLPATLMLTVPPPSRAGSLPQGSRPHPKSRLHPKSCRSRACSRKRCVRRWRGCLCRRLREQALLLQISVEHKGPCTPQIKCGSEPAGESAVSGNEHVDLAAAFAGKPGSHRVLGVPKIPIKPPDNCRSRACSRKRCVRRWRGCLCRRHREQALLLQISVGYKGPCTPQIKCGSEPAGESAVSGNEHVDLAAAFAGKPGSHRVLGRTQNPDQTTYNVGAELAREGGVSGDGEVVCADAIASKLCSYRFLSNTKPVYTQIKCGSGLARESVLSDTASINGGYPRRKYRHSHQSRPCAPPRNTHRPATSTTAPARFLRRPNHAPVGVRC